MRGNHSKKFFSLLTAFLMIISLVSLPTVTALADDSQPAVSQPADSQPADTQPTDTPAADPQPTEVLPSDCGLASLSFSDGATTYDLLSKFDQNKNIYSASVGADVDSVTISVAANDPLAKVSGDTGTVKLSAGDNAFKVIVTAQDGTTKEYDITITRANPPVKAMDIAPWLTGISVSNGSTEYFDPENFDKDTKSYTVTVTSDVGVVDVEGTPSDSNASVSGGGQQNLSYGDNPCSLVVSLNGASTEYDLTITRSAPDSGTFQDFDFQNKGTYMAITGYDADDGTVTIPDTIFGLPVKAIGDGAFCGKDMTNIVIPDGITDIGDNAFEDCDSLEAITLPNSLENIGSEAFWDCSSLSNLTIPENVSSLGDMFAYGCSSLDSISVADGNGNYTVQDGILFTSDKKTIIFCPQLNDFDGNQYTIPDSVETICEYAFSDCGNLNSVTVPETIKALPEGCFEDCGNLESVTFSEGTTSIGDYAFEGCGSLDDVTLPASLSSVSGLSFAGCSSLSGIGVAEGSSYYKSGDDGVLYSADGKVLVACPGGYWDQEGGDEDYGRIKADGNIKALCYDESDDDPFTVPDTVDEIGKGAFAESGITSIDFGSGVTKIDEDAFYECGGLQVLTVPNSVETIGSEAFDECGSLQSVTLGTGLDTLSPVAFDDCGSLTAIYFLGNAPNVDTSESDAVFPRSNDHLTLYYAAGKTGYGSPNWLGYPAVAFDPNVKYTVTYDFNGESGSIDPIQVFGGGKAIFVCPDSDSGDSFLGWYKDSACTTPWRFGTDTVTSNVTIYALWASQNNAYLDNVWLKDSDGNYLDLSPEFDSNIYTYNVSLGQKESGFCISADADADNAKIYIDGKARDYKEYNKVKANSSVTVAITVKCGKQTKIYTVTVTKEISTDVDLSSLTAKTKSGDELCLDPSFDPDVLGYKLELDEDTSSVTITAAKDDDLEKVYIDGKAKLSKTYNKINPGDTVLCTVKVVAQSKDVLPKIYTVNITRDEDTDANLKSLKTNLSKYGVTPKFDQDQDQDSYEVYLPENIGSVILYAQAEGYQATTTFTNADTKQQLTQGFMNVKVNNGDYQTINIEVEAQASTDDNPIINDYTVTVYRAAKIKTFSATPKAALSPGGDNTLTFNWTQIGDGTVNIEAYIYDKDDSKWEWESINSDDYTDGQQSYEWDGSINGEYLDPNTYNVRISVSYDSEDQDHTITSLYKTLKVKILAAPHITLTVSPATITEGGDQTTNINVRWDVATRVKIQVFDEDDDLVATLKDDYFTTKSLVCNWDGTDDEDDALDPGTYKIVVTAGSSTKTAFITIAEDDSDE